MPEFVLLFNGFGRHGGTAQDLHKPIFHYVDTYYSLGRPYWIFMTHARYKISKS